MKRIFGLLLKIASAISFFFFLAFLLAATDQPKSDLKYAIPLIIFSFLCCIFLWRWGKSFRKPIKCIECDAEIGVTSMNYAGMNIREKGIKIYPFINRIEELILPGDSKNDYLCGDCANKRNVTCKKHGTITDKKFKLDSPPQCLECNEEYEKVKKLKEDVGYKGEINDDLDGVVLEYIAPFSVIHEKNIELSIKGYGGDKIPNVNYTSSKVINLKKDNDVLVLDVNSSNEFSGDTKSIYQIDKHGRVTNPEAIITVVDNDASTVADALKSPKLSIADKEVLLKSKYIEFPSKKLFVGDQIRIENLLKFNYYIKFYKNLLSNLSKEIKLICTNTEFEGVFPPEEDIIFTILSIDENKIVIALKTFLTINGGITGQHLCAIFELNRKNPLIIKGNMEFAWQVSSVEEAEEYVHSHRAVEKFNSMVLKT